MGQSPWPLRLEIIFGNTMAEVLLGLAAEQDLTMQLLWSVGAVKAAETTGSSETHGVPVGARVDTSELVNPTKVAQVSVVS